MKIDMISTNSVYTQTREQEVQKKEAETTQTSYPQDEYISSEKNPQKPSGLYKVSTDANGNRKITFEDPNASKSSKSSGQTTTDTSSVDNEISQLKQTKNQLTQQIKSAGDDEKKRSQLEAQLASVEAQIAQKDNDTYRKQNASVS